MAIREIIEHVHERDSTVEDWFTRRELFASGDFHVRHDSGPDGLGEEQWSAVYSAPIQDAEKRHNVRAEVLIKGDDLLIFLVRDCKHGLCDGEEYKAQYPDEVEKDHRAFTDDLYESLERVGFKIKKKSSTPVGSTGVFSKLITVGTAVLPLLTKVVEGISPHSNSGYPTVEAQLQQCKSSAEQAQLFHHRPILPAMIGIMSQVRVLRDTEQLDVLSGRRGLSRSVHGVITERYRG